MEETSWRLTTELASTPASGFLAQMPRLEMMKLESFFGTQVMPSQWEFQVGPTEGIDMGDDLWVARLSQDHHRIIRGSSKDHHNTIIPCHAKNYTS